MSRGRASHVMRRRAGRVITTAVHVALAVKLCVSASAFKESSITTHTGKVLLAPASVLASLLLHLAVAPSSLSFTFVIRLEAPSLRVGVSLPLAAVAASVRPHAFA